ncbi:EAL domain-containing protein [Aliikangiella sp. IMCC44653]
MKTLIIDDDRVDRAALIRDLKCGSFSHDITEASTGSEGLKMFKAKPFDCVFLDYDLPDLQGPEILREMHKISDDSVSVVGITGIKGEVQAEEMIEAGATDYLLKDEINPFKIDRTLKYAIKRREYYESASSKFRHVFKHSNDSLFIMDKNGIVVDANLKAQKVWKRDRYQLVNSDFEWLKAKCDSSRPIKKLLSELQIREDNANEGPVFEMRLKKPQGGFFYAEVSASQIYFDGNELFLATVRDISEQRNIESLLKESNRALVASNKRLEDLSETDMLTGTLNRRGMENIIGRAVKSAKREKKLLVSILIDIDEFKQINDALGYTSGDIVLKETAIALQSTIRPSDYLSRIGGAQFVALIQVSNMEESKTIAERMRSTCKRFKLENIETIIENSISLGVAVVDLNTVTLGDLINSSQRALNNSSGKDSITYISDFESLPQTITKAKKIKEDILSNDGVASYKQAIIDLNTKKLVAYEYLARGPQGIYFTPDNLFRFALEENILSKVDFICFKKSLEASVKDKGVQAHINLFPSTLLELSVSFLLDHLAPFLGKNQVCIEISEQQIIGDPGYLKGHIFQLFDAGIQVAIDDIGFGRSCLENLIYLRPHILKIDKKRVFEVSKDKEKREELAKLIKIAQAVNAQIIAEGVETIDDLRVLEGMGVQFAQGYYWGKPVPSLDD